MFKRKLNSKWYLENNPDVAASGISPEEHYRHHGRREGRLPCPPNAFDKLWARTALFLKTLQLLAKQQNGYINAVRIINKQLSDGGVLGLKHFIVRKFKEHERFQSSVDYSKWIQKNDYVDTIAISEKAQVIAAAANAPTISIVMATYNTPVPFLKAAIESVTTQAYPLWQLCIADDHSNLPETLECLKSYAQRDARIKVLYRTQNGHISAATNSAITLAEGDFIAFMDHDDELHPAALTLVAQTIHHNPDVEFIYTDEDKIDEQGNRSEPHFKSDFNYELLLTQNYICHLAVFKKSLVNRINGLDGRYNGAQDHDFILRALEHITVDKIFHIPKVLYHWRIHSASTAASAEAKPYAITAGRQAVSDHLKRSGIKAGVSAHPNVSFWHKIRFELNTDPSIDIIIPTRDRIDLMRMCVNSILKKSSYKNYRIIIVDNGSVETDTLDQFKKWADKEPKITVLRDDSPFNYSRLNNQAVWKSKATLVCLLNNDIEIITPDWLEEMAGIAMRDEIGCVGARLWYPNDTLQHGGVILGIGGIAGHSHKYWHKGDPGYFGRAISLQALSAVTAACLMIRRETYQQVNGLDEDMKVAFNDVDFCLRVREQGFRNVWTPFAEMYHHESASRGQEDNPEKIARFQAEIDFMKNRWGEKLTTDYFYSPNLTLVHEDFSLADVSRAPRN